MKPLKFKVGDRVAIKSNVAAYPNARGVIRCCSTTTLFPYSVLLDGFGMCAYFENELVPPVSHRLIRRTQNVQT